MEIQKLNCDVISQIRSSFSINSVSQCVNELASAVFNSLDAKSSAIAVRVNLVKLQIQVVDNGQGISQENLSNVGVRYWTSKCLNLNDLNKNTKYYGYRGEALASISSLCKSVTIVSKQAGSGETYSKTIEGSVNHPVISVKNRPSCGTTVTVEVFLKNMAVRKKSLKAEFEIEDIKNSLERLIIIHPTVSFSFRNDITNQLVINQQKQQDVIASFKNLNPDIDGNFNLLKVTKGNITVQGLFHCSFHHNKKHQYIYVNKRPIICPKIQKLVCSMYRRNEKMKQKFDIVLENVQENLKHPIFIINIKCPYSDVDILLNPSKTMVEFKHWDAVASCLEKLISSFLGNKELISKKLESKARCHDYNSDCGVSQIVGVVKGFGYKRKQEAIDNLISHKQQKFDKDDAFEISRHKEDNSVKSGHSNSFSEDILKETPIITNKKPGNSDKLKMIDSKKEFDIPAITNCVINDDKLEKDNNSKRKSVKESEGISPNIFSTVETVEASDSSRMLPPKALIPKRKPIKPRKALPIQVKGGKPKKVKSILRNPIKKSEEIKLNEIIPSDEDDSIFFERPITRDKLNNESKGKHLIMDMFLKSTQIYKELETSEDDSQNSLNTILESDLVFQNNIKTETHELNTTISFSVKVKGKRLKKQKNGGNGFKGNGSNILDALSFTNFESKKKRIEKLNQVLMETKVKTPSPLLKSEKNMVSKYVQTSIIQEKPKKLEPELKKSLRDYREQDQLKYIDSFCGYRWDDCNRKPVLDYFPKVTEECTEQSPLLFNFNNASKRIEETLPVHNNNELQSFQPNIIRKWMKKYISDYSFNFSNIKNFPVIENLNFLPAFDHDKTTKIFDFGKCKERQLSGRINTFSTSKLPTLDEDILNKSFIISNLTNKATTLENINLSPIPKERQRINISETYKPIAMSNINYFEKNTWSSCENVLNCHYPNFGANGHVTINECSKKIPLRYVENKENSCYHTHKESLYYDSLERNSPVSNRIKKTELWKKFLIDKMFKTSNRLHSNDKVRKTGNDQQIKNDKFRESVAKNKPHDGELKLSLPKSTIPFPSQNKKDTRKITNEMSIYHCKNSSKKNFAAPIENFNRKYFNNQARLIQNKNTRDNLTMLNTNRQKYPFSTIKNLEEQEMIPKLYVTDMPNNQQQTILAVTNSPSKGTFQKRLSQNIAACENFYPKFTSTQVDKIEGVQRQLHYGRENDFRIPHSYIEQGEKTEYTPLRFNLSQSIASFEHFDPKIFSTQANKNENKTIEHGNTSKYFNSFEFSTIIPVENFEIPSWKPSFPILEGLEKPTEFFNVANTGKRFTEGKFFDFSKKSREVKTSDTNNHRNIHNQGFKYYNVASRPEALTGKHIKNHSEANLQTHGEPKDLHLQGLLSTTTNTKTPTSAIDKLELTLSENESHLDVTLNIIEKDLEAERNLNESHFLKFEENCQENLDVNIWEKQANKFGSYYYVNKRTGMATFYSPKLEVNQFDITKRPNFVPKGLSPLLKKTKLVDKSLSQNTRHKLQNAIIESYDNELITVKWQNYIGNHDPKQFFEEIYKDKTKLFEQQIPNICYPKHVRRFCETRVFTKDLFTNLKIIGQFDKKFMAAIDTTDNLLVVFDQHAVHERIRLEAILKEYKCQIAPCDTKITVFLPESDLVILKSHYNYLQSIGFTIEFFPNCITILEAPLCIQEKLKKKNNDNEKIKELLSELIEILRSTKGIPPTIPKTIHDALSLEACRSAIKFGDVLTKNDCKDHLQKLSICNLPFQCAHGRPSITPLLYLNRVSKNVRFQKLTSRFFGGNNCWFLYYNCLFLYAYLFND